MIATGCATTTATKPSENVLSVALGNPVCATTKADIYTEYPTANISSCEALSDGRFKIMLEPENTPINNSPWYGFYIKPKQEGRVRVTLKYRGGTHRYPAKLSSDGRKWTVINPRDVIKKADDEIELSLDLKQQGLFVSAQEILSTAAHEAWIAKAAKLPFLSMSSIGASLDGRAIQKLDTNSGDKPYVILVGRQHPPELTGALAMMPFMDTVFGDTALAGNFREQFNVIAVPLMNPDGVDAGHWRSNKNGQDLNRDWGPFAQPETNAIKSMLDELEARGQSVAFFLDFHSTSRNLLYTQTDDEPTSPPKFARDWLKLVDDRLDDTVYAFTREPSPNSDRPTSKNYMYDRYGISAITYEVGDHTNRKAISDAAKVFAEEMMRLLMKYQDQ